MKKLINYFLQGLLYIVPITVTIAAVVWAFKEIDEIIPTLLAKLGVEIQFPGLGIIIIVVLITIIGFLGRVVITSPISSFFQNALKMGNLSKPLRSLVFLRVGIFRKS